jgi:hypothetical protein
MGNEDTEDRTKKATGKAIAGQFCGCIKMRDAQVSPDSIV